MFWDSMDCECAIGIMGNVGCPLHDPRLKEPEPEPKPLYDTTKVKHYSTNLVYICKFCNKEILGSAQTSKEGIFHEKCFEPWKKGFRFECPKCNSTGELNPKNGYPHTCNLCNGDKYLKIKPKPITAIIDWEL